MAKAKNPLLSIAVTGQLAGLLFRQGTYGQTISRRSLSAVTRTPAQTRQRGRLKRAHAAWTALSAPVRAQWDAIAPYPETGRNAYIRAFTILNKVNITPQPDPPGYQSNTTLSNLTAVYLALPGNPILISWTHTGDEWDLILIYSLPTWSSGDYSKPSEYTYQTYQIITADYAILQPKFPTPHIWIRVEHRSRHTAALLDQATFKLNYP